MAIQTMTNKEEREQPAAAGPQPEPDYAPGLSSGAVGRPASSTWDRAQVLGLLAPELQAYQDEPAQMASASVGKNGYLHVAFERRGARTAMVGVERRIPFLVQRALYWDLAMPDMACVYIITTSGGTLQGDRYSVDIEVGEDACAHLTTQSATKLQSMDSNYASMAQTIRLRPGAYLEYLPLPTIPHRHSRFITETRIERDPTATLLYSEVLVPGRRYHHPDEYFGFDVYSSCVRACDPEGKEGFCEKFVLEPRARPLTRLGVMGQFEVFGNVLLLTPRHHADMVLERTEPGLDSALPLAWGASRLPNDAGLVFKVLGMEVKPVQEKIREFWKAARAVVKGAEVPPPFLWREPSFN